MVKQISEIPPLAAPTPIPYLPRMDLSPFGPLLFLDTIADNRLHLAALFGGPASAPPPGPVTVGGAQVQPTRIARIGDLALWRARFSVPADAPGVYGWGGDSFALAADLRGDLRLAYVSCNGEEHGDLARDPVERNALWARLAAEHRAQPFALILHGGDQVYADEAVRGHPLTDGWPNDIPDDPAPEALDSLRAHLRARFAERYLALCRAPDFAWIAARVPALMQWDDHDICDGWGSLRARTTQSAVGQVLFSVAREMALLFQHGTVQGDLPARFHDPDAAALDWQVAAPGLRILGPDLRSGRGRRAVMDTGGWRMIDAAAHPEPGQTLILSSVPLLGPRLSLLEAVLILVPRLQKYEDDLRDQWQSRAHRASWQRMLRAVRAMSAPGAGVTALSGEIHLAGRAEMTLGEGRVLHQLIASGIAHRPPPAGWARFLGALSFLGDAPLDGHPIVVRPLPGQRQRYVAQRNFLELVRSGSQWQARWQLESSGWTPPLAL